MMRKYVNRAMAVVEAVRVTGDMVARGADLPTGSWSDGEVVRIAPRYGVGGIDVARVGDWLVRGVTHGQRYLRVITDDLAFRVMYQEDAERDAAIAAEREACAKRLDAMHAKFRRFAGDRDNWCDEKRDAYAEAALEASTEAAAIRARGNQ